MASFLKRAKEEINPAIKIDELKGSVGDDAVKDQFDFSVTRGLCWHVVFAPDESYFAWISTPKKVILVPWDKVKASTIRPKSELPSTSQLLPNASNEESPPWITIECGYPVLSVAFGSGAPQAVPKSKTCWTRFDFTKEIVFATGHANGRIRIWNVRTGVLLLELSDHRLGVRDLSFAPDGSLRLISASLDKTLKGWDLHDDGNMFKTFYAHQNSVVWCCWSPNARLMASTGSDKSVIVWNMEDYKLFRRLDGHYHEVVSCSFSPDGAILATASWDSQVNLWDPYTGVKIRSLYHLHPPPNMIYACGANSAWVRGVSFCRNGANIATISDDHMIRFWNLLGDDDPEGIATEEDDILSCSYSPSGRCLAVGTAKFKVSFYTAPSTVPSLAHLARMTVRRNVLTPEVEKLEIPQSLKSYLKYESWY